MESAMRSIQHDRLASVGVQIRDALAADLDAATLYRILALRSAVFVVEQNCPYLDPDGRDLEPTARQVWAERDDEVLATLRVLTDDGRTARIGRVATARAARGEGLAARLMDHALRLTGELDVVLDAQTYLYEWYRRFGFERAGDDFVEDGIPHVPMRLVRPA
jgi:ElaA protein